MKRKLSLLLAVSLLSATAFAQTNGNTGETLNSGMTPPPAPGSTPSSNMPSSQVPPAPGTTTAPAAGTTAPGAAATQQAPSNNGMNAAPSTQAPAATPADNNKKTGESFLLNNKNQAGVVTLPDGLQYKVIVQGNGPKPSKADMVTVDYEGKHINGQIFDSSYQRGQPATFPLAGVIPGWQEALQLMNTGSTWEIFIPATLAYGERGVPGAIEPNETLVFKVHLINVQKAS